MPDTMNDSVWTPNDTDIPPPPGYESSNVWTPDDKDIPPPPGYSESAPNIAESEKRVKRRRELEAQYQNATVSVWNDNTDSSGKKTFGSTNINRPATPEEIGVFIDKQLSKEMPEGADSGSSANLQRNTNGGNREAGRMVYDMFGGVIGGVPPTEQEALQAKDSAALNDALRFTAEFNSSKDKYGKRTDEEYKDFIAGVSRRSGQDLKPTPELIQSVKPYLDAYDLLRSGKAISAPPELRPYVLEALQQNLTSKDKREKRSWLENTIGLTTAGMIQKGSAYGSLNPALDEGTKQYQAQLDSLVADPARFVNPDQGKLSKNVQSLIATLAPVAMAGGTQNTVVPLFSAPGGIETYNAAKARGADWDRAMSAGVNRFGWETALFSLTPSPTKFFSNFGGKEVVKNTLKNTLLSTALETGKTFGVMEANTLQAKMFEELAVRSSKGGQAKTNQALWEEFKESIPDTAIQSALLHIPQVIRGIAALPDNPARKVFEEAGGPKVSAEKRAELVKAARESLQGQEPQPQGVSDGIQAKTETQGNPEVGQEVLKPMTSGEAQATPEALPPKKPILGKRVDTDVSKMSMNELTQRYEASQKGIDEFEDKIVEKYGEKGLSYPSSQEKLAENMGTTVESLFGPDPLSAEDRAKIDSLYQQRELYGTEQFTRNRNAIANGLKDAGIGDDLQKTILNQVFLMDEESPAASWETMAKQGGEVLSNKQQAVPEIAKFIASNYARENGLDLDGLFGPMSGLTDVGKRNLVQQWEKQAESAYDAILKRLGGVSESSVSGTLESVSKPSATETTPEPTPAPNVTETQPESVGGKPYERKDTTITIDSVRTAPLEELGIVGQAIKEWADGKITDGLSASKKQQTKRTLLELKQGKPSEDMRQQLLEENGGQKAVGIPGQRGYREKGENADPLATLFFMEDIERTDAVDKSITSIEKGEPDELAQRVQALIEKQTGNPIVVDKEVKDALQKLRGKSSFFPKAEDSDSGVTGTSHANTADMRFTAGLPERQPTEPGSQVQWNDEAARLRKENPELENQIIEETLTADNPRPFGPIEDAIIGQRLREMENARLAGNGDLDAYQDTIMAAEKAHSAWGKAGVEYQAELDADFSLRGLTRNFIKRTGRKATPDEFRDIIEQKSKIIEEMEAENKRLKAAEEKAFKDDTDLARIKAMQSVQKAEAKARKEADQAKNGMVERKLNPDGSYADEAKKPIVSKKKPKAEATEQPTKIKKAWSELWDALGKNPGVSSFGIPMPDPKWSIEVITAASKVVRAYVEEGASSLYGLIKKASKEFGADKVDELKPLFAGAWDEMRKSGELPKPEEISLEDRVSLYKQGQEILKGFVELNLDKKVDEKLIEESNRYVWEELKRFNPDITLDQAYEATSGAGIRRLLKQDAASVMLREIKGPSLATYKQRHMEKQLDKNPEDRVMYLLTGIEQGKTTDITRDINKVVNELVREANIQPKTDEQRGQSALQTRKTLREHQIRDMQKELETGERIVKGKVEIIPDAELKEIEKDYATIKENWNAEFKKPKTEEEKIDDLIKVLERQTARLEANNKAGIIGRALRKSKLDSPALTTARLRLEAARAERDVLRANDPKFQADEKVRLEAQVRSQLARSLLDWQERRQLSEEGISYKGLSRASIKKVLNPSLNVDQKKALAKKLAKSTKAADRDNSEIRRTIEQTKRETEAIIDNIARSERTKLGKLVGGGADLVDLSQSIMTGFEISPVLRQGLPYTMGFPEKAIPAIWNSVKAAFSKRIEFLLHEDLMNRPNASEYRIGKLERTETTGPLNVREELLRSRLVDWLASGDLSVKNFPYKAAAKALQGGTRFFRTFANTMRADLFDYMKKTVEQNRSLSEDDAKIIGNASNLFSGRGNVGPSAVGLSRIFFAPRWVWSRVQLAAGQPIWKGDYYTRKAIGKVYVRWALGMGAYLAMQHVIYSLLAKDDKHKPRYETDLRSSDFNKMVVGDTRFDTGAGFNQLAVLAARLKTGETKTKEGKIVPISGEEVTVGDDAFDVMARFGRSKLAPLPSGVIDYITGKNLVGKPATAASILRERMSPMTWNDIFAAEKELGVAQGTVASIQAFMGEGVNTYNDKKRKKPIKKYKWYDAFPGS